jgi:hypothetical protein
MTKSPLCLLSQDVIGMMNENNPSGNVAGSQLHIAILIVVLTVSLAVGVKRFLIGLHLGRQTYSKSSKLLVLFLWHFL